MKLFDVPHPTFLLCLFVSCTVASAQPLLADTDSKNFRLESSRKTGDIFRIRALLKVKGKLKIKLEDGQHYEPSVQAKSKLAYDEKPTNVMTGSGKNFRVIRHYNLAQAEIAIDRKTTAPVLRPERRTIVHTTAKEPAYFSPQGPLTRDELDLIDIPGDTLFLEDLLPVGTVVVGQTWPLSGLVLQRWLRLDDVGQANVHARLLSIKAGQAHFEMKGHLTGIASGVVTNMELLAKYQFDLGKKHITRLAMDIQEKRVPGFAEPGFDVLARLHLRVSQAKSDTPSSIAEVAPLEMWETTGQPILEFQSQRGDFSMLHDSHWHVILDNDHTTMLRLVHGDNLIAQCNVARPSTFPSPEPQTLTDFQREIRQALGEHFGEFVEVEESQLESKLKRTRIVVLGTVDKLPICWTYYQLTNTESQRTTLVFTYELGTEEDFAGADETMIQSFTFLAKPNTDQNLTAIPKIPETARSEDSAKTR